MHGANHHWRCVKSSSPWKDQSPEAKVQRNQRPKSRVQRRESRETRVKRVQFLQRLEFRPVLCLLCNLSLLLLLVYHHKYLWFVPYATSENQAGMQPSPPPHQTKILGGFHMELFVWGHQTQGRQEGRSCETVCVRASNLRATGGSVCNTPPPLARPAYR